MASLGLNTKDGSMEIFDKDGNITKGVDTTKLQLINQAEYLFGQQSTIVEAAKTRLYSIAFDYNPDNIYSQSLYSTLQKYVLKETDQ
jgi:hypothetical protein